MAKKRKQRARGLASKAPAPIVNIAEKRSVRESIEPGRKMSIFLAVPTLSGFVHFSITHQFGRAMHSTGLPECPFFLTTHVLPGIKGIDYARNKIVHTFLYESDCDWLLMVDADQTLPDNFWQMCMIRDADVVSALTPVWVGNATPEEMLRVNQYGVDDKQRCFNLPMPPKEVKQPYRVPIVGTGCIAIRRRVFAPPPVGIGDHPFHFTRDEMGKVIAGEDVNFGTQVNRAGFIIAAHPGIWSDHVKDLHLLQVKEYYDARSSMEREGRTTSDEQRLSIG